MPLPTFLSAKEMQALQELLRTRAPANFMRYHYRAGDYDLTPYVVEASWGRSDGASPAKVFTGTFKQSLPRSLRKETLTVDLAVVTSEGALTFRRYTGDIRTLVNRRGGATIEAASGGYWLDKIRFDEAGVTYADVAPSDVVWDVTNRAAEAGAYDMRYADIETVEGPKVRREEFLAITALDKLSRPLEAAVEEGELFFRDSGYNSPLCHRDRGPAEATEILHEYVVGRDIDSGDFQPQQTSDEYYDVVAYRTAADGTPEFLFDPILIPGSAAPVGVGYEIAVSDESGEAISDAYDLATRAAARLIDGESTVRFPTRFPHPLMVDGDMLSIVEPFSDGATTGVRYWLAEVDVQAEHHDLTHELEVLMVHRREETDVLPVVPALSPARVRGG